MSRTVVRAFAAIVFITGAATAALSQEPGDGAAGVPSVRCSLCHGDAEFLEGKRVTPAQAATLLVTDSLLRPSVHAGLACADCHPSHAQGYPHRADARARSCAECHAPAGEAWARSIHASNAAVQGDAAGCVDCHGSHEIFRSDDRRSSTHALNVAGTCARCHADPEIIGEYFVSPDEPQARVAVEQYYQTVHGTALTESGLVVSATCNDCHGAHAILPSEAPASTVHRTNIASTCGACHVGVLETFEASAHGVALRTKGSAPGSRQAPVCVDCHTSHQIVRADEPRWFIGVVEECGQCHERVYETYFETYHGKVTRLGFGLTAKCSDCHTAHNMRAASDTASSIHPLRLVATCARCHPGANATYVQYFAHGDHRDRNQYPVLYWTYLIMTSLLIGVWTFWGVHTALWFTRLLIDRSRRNR